MDLRYLPGLLLILVLSSVPSCSLLLGRADKPATEPATATEPAPPAAGETPGQTIEKQIPKLVNDPGDNAAWVSLLVAVGALAGGVVTHYMTKRKRVADEDELESGPPASDEDSRDAG